MKTNIPSRLYTLLLAFGYDKVWTSGEIVAYGSTKLGVNPGSIMPADYDVAATRPSAHSTRIFAKSGKGYKLVETPVVYSANGSRNGESVADKVARLEAELAAMQRDKESNSAGA